MSIDLTPELLLAPEAVGGDLAGFEDYRPRPARRVDRVMDRLLGSRALWLAPIVLVQCVLSFRPSTALAANEAGSISAGHQLIAHLLHGTPTPAFGSYFAGVPTLYAVPAALLSDIGGVFLVRLASTALALLATVFVYLAARRLFGQGAALIAGGLFGLNAFTLFMARVASGDALCVALLAAGLWLAVSCEDRPRRAVALGPCIVLASAVSYLALPFAAALVVVATVHNARSSGHDRPRRVLGLALGSLLVSAGVAALAVAPGDWTGMKVTLLDHHVMTAAATSSVHHQLISDIGPLLVVAAIALFASRRNRIVAALLLLTALLPVALQTYLGTGSPVHDTYGLAIVFLTPLVGVTGMAMLRRGRLLGLRAPLAVAGMVIMLATGLSGSNQLMHDRPSSAVAISSPVPVNR